MYSPAFAPERSTAFPLGTDPTTTMSACIPPADCAVSPPASGTFNSFAKFSNPFRKRSTHRCGTSRETARDKNAARGSPPMAAISLSPRVRQRRPTNSGGCQSRRKWTFSMLKSVVTSSSCLGGTRSTAQSSPMPATTDAPPLAEWRICLISFFSLNGMSVGIFDQHLDNYTLAARGHSTPLTGVIWPSGHCQPRGVGNHPKGRREVDRGEPCLLRLTRRSQKLWPKQVLQHESVAAELHFGLTWFRRIDPWCRHVVLG